MTETETDSGLEHYLERLEEQQPPAPARVSESKGWYLHLNPTQQKIFDSAAEFILAYGEKGSGKSIGCLHALIRHCYEEKEALALILAPQIRTGKEGVMYDLMWCLDIWRNGNWADREQTKRRDDGIGLEYTEPSLDPQTKDRIVYIANRHGGWSKVVLVSIPYAEVVEKRMKSLSPSFVYADELTELDSKDFFTYVAQQLGRRRGIVGPQQYVASCNPEGPSHWVYEVFWLDCLDPETEVRDPAYEAYHVPIQENYDNLPPGYVEKLNKLYKDPTDIERLLKGRWIDRPSGQAIFKPYFRQELHVKGDLRNGEGLIPFPGIPIVVTYDPGPMNYSIHFEQMVPTKTKVIWNVIDELNYVGQFTPDHLIVRDVLRRMEYWNSNFMNGQAPFIHIADATAFTHRRHDGTYDATRLRDISKAQTNGQTIIKVRSAIPPGHDAKLSVPARVQMIVTMFLAETLFISAMCPKTIEMVRLLVSQTGKEGKYDENLSLTPKRSPYLHPFDSMSYGPYYFSLMPAHFAIQTAEVETGGVFRAGRG